MGKTAQECDLRMARWGSKQRRCTTGARRGYGRENWPACTLSMSRLYQVEHLDEMFRLKMRSFTWSGGAPSSAGVLHRCIGAAQERSSQEVILVECLSESGSGLALAHPAPRILSVFT